MYAPLSTVPTTGFRPGVGMSGLGYFAGGNGPRGGNRGWHPLLGALGDAAISSDSAAQLVADGVDAALVQQASQLGMTESQADAILALDDSDAETSAMQQLIATLQAQNVSSTNIYGSTLGPAANPTSTATPPTPTAPTASSVPAQSPPGSTLLYSCQYNVNTLVPGGSLLVTPTNLISQLTAKLAPYGMSITGSPSTSYAGNTFSVSVLDSIGHQYFTDAKSVLDSLMNSLSGVSVVSSSLTPSQIAGTNQPTPAAASSSFTQWLEDNATTIGIVAVAAFVLPGVLSSIIKKF